MNTIRIDMVGHTWGGYVARGSLRPSGRPDGAYTYYMPVFALDKQAPDQSIADWLDQNSGDFEMVSDFQALLPDGTVIGWDDPECEELWLQWTGDYDG